MTIIGIILMLVLAMIGFPLYLGIIACGIFIIVFDLHVSASFPLGQMFTKVADYNLLAIPLFVFLGQVLATGGAGKALVRFLNAFMGHIQGGTAYALVLASVLVAAMCAHPLAAIAGFGPLIIPIMISLGYSEVFAVGILLAGASLAPLIPPSTMSIIYAFIATQAQTGDIQAIDVTTMWTASIVPGLIIALMLCVIVYIYVKKTKTKVLPAASWTERWESFKLGWPVVFTPVVILGPLYLNWANPTEVAAIGIIYVVFISRVFYKGVSWRSFWQAGTSTVRVLGAIFLIIMAALLLNYVFIRAQVPQDLTKWITDMGLNWWMFIAVLIVLYVIMGMFLDPSAIVLVVVPMLVPTAKSLGIDLYAFGVFTVVAIVLAGMTPPYGLTIFAAQSILGMPYHKVVKSCILFLPALLIGMVLAAYIAPLSTWLPSIIK